MHNEQMSDCEMVRHDSCSVHSSDGGLVRVQIDGHYCDLLPEMALDLAEYMKRLVGAITDNA